MQPSSISTLSLEDATTGTDDNCTSLLFHLTLDEIIHGQFLDLTSRQQKRQRSKKFESYGLQWVLTLEKDNPTDVRDKTKFNILVSLYCLSVSLKEAKLESFPLKGDIIISHLEEHQQMEVFNGQKGQACNIVGKDRPADLILLKNFNFTLKSGLTKSDLTLKGGYYGHDYRSYARKLLLENHSYNSTRDGAEIKVTLKFNQEAQTLRYMDDEWP